MNTSGNKPLQPFIILFLAVGLLIILSATDRYFISYHKDLKHLNLFAGVIKEVPKKATIVKKATADKAFKDTSKFIEL
jgi:hypothetical protein